jgi:hypothetical protein
MAQERNSGELLKRVPGRTWQLSSLRFSQAKKVLQEKRKRKDLCTYLSCN